MGTPQGGVVSPCLANLFLHYAFDVWMGRTYPGLSWCRYADDGLIHCSTEAEAQAVKNALMKRLEECGLVLHPDKTKIVYCKDWRRRLEHSNNKFDFLGYCFRPRVAKGKKENIFVGFNPAVSEQAKRSMRQKIRKLNLRNRSDLELSDISRMYNPILRGWYQYYGKYRPSELKPVWKHFNKTLVSWSMAKYKHLKGHKVKASLFISKMAERQPHLFTHWKLEGGKSFA